MPEFRSPTDIGNRALQHLGQRQMNAALGFNEISKNASETGFAYGKLRQAELHRNVWRFAVKRQVLRAIDGNTLTLAPTLFSQSATYFYGSIVADANGNLWTSNIPNNTGNDPLTSPFWDPYFGPMTVALYDATQSYFAGELVYTAAGDGTFNVYQSLLTGNTLDPSLPNQWNAATTYQQNQIVQTFPAWAIGTTYAAGATVTDGSGLTYTSLAAGNVGNTPSTSPIQWAVMPVLSLAPTQESSQSTISLLAPSTSSPIIEFSPYVVYTIGQFVLFAGNVYVSLVNNNSNNQPNAAGSTSWAEVTDGTLYMSMFNLNAGNNPANSPPLWTAATSYALGQQVGGSDGNIYTSLVHSNSGNDPVTDSGVHWQNTGVLLPWTTVFTQGAGNQQWLQIGGAAFPFGVGLSVNAIIYPLGTGPCTDTMTMNIFRLPANYLRKAPRDPKAGSFTDLGAPTNLMYDDWRFESDYIVSRQFDPIMFRFVADIVDVTRMDPMFCEGLAARVGLRNMRVADTIDRKESRGKKSL